MTIMRKHFGDFPTINDWIGEIFGKDAEEMLTHPKRTVPSVNIAESNTYFTIEVAAPGLEKNDFKIDLDNDLLTVSAEKKEKQEETEKMYKKKEFCYCTFKRSFTLPETADSEKISAKYEAGVLIITIMKKDTAIVKPVRNIDID